jgi:formate hydrogenlyase subunit 3/multisubunit Na+/H+ antiporter MnhD subunit
MDSDARFEKAERLGKLISSLPKWTAYAIIAWQARLSIEALAGKGAPASLLTRFARETSSWELVSWIAGSLGIIFGLYSRYLLRRYRTQKPFGSVPSRWGGRN